MSPCPPVSTTRLLLAWCVMIGPLALFWACRPLLSESVFDYGQVPLLLGTWKVASLLCLAPEAWARFSWPRFLAYLVWPGMQPRQFLAGQVSDPRAPRPTVRGLLLDILAGAALLWIVPRLLPDSTPLAIRFWIGLAGFCLLFLVARLDFWALVFRALGFQVEKLWVQPLAATSLGDFWGQRWNRLVSGFLREVVFVPLARRAGSRFALFGVFLFSGFYHEMASFLGGAGYGGPMLYFLVQYLGVALENVRPVRRWLHAWPWLGRTWTLVVIVGPLGLFDHSGFVDRILLPMLVEAGVPGLG